MLTNFKDFVTGQLFLPWEESRLTTSEEKDPAVVGIFCCGVFSTDGDGEL